MKILHVLSSVARRYGGPSVAVRGMSSALAALGAEVTVATTDADGPGRSAPRYDVPVIERGVAYRYFRRASWSAGWHFSLDLTRWLAGSIGDFDVVEVHGMFTYTTIPGCRLASRAGVPYVVRPLGTLGAWSLAQRTWKKRPYYKFVERPNLAAAAAIHVTAESEAAELRALGFGEKTRIIPLGVDTDVAQIHPRADGRLRLLFLSRIHPKKGLELVLAALALLRERGVTGISLVVAGEGDAGYVGSLRAEVGRLGLETIVRFVGPLHDEAKRSAFADADVFVLTSHHENFGIAAAEALAAGIPVILSGEVGLAHDVAASGAGLVVPLDPAVISAAIEDLRNKPTLRSEMAERALTYASAHLSWARCARQLHALYEEITADSRLRRVR